MMHRNFINSLFAFTMVLFVWTSCGDNMGENNTPLDTFDRAAMLTHWANNFIIPGYTEYDQKLDLLKSRSDQFLSSPNIDDLLLLRSAFLDAYTTWQTVSMFEFGKAEELRMRNRTNVYPADVQAIQTNINTGQYNLSLPSTIDQQGFPAIDYLLGGFTTNDEEVVAFYADDTQGQNRRTYLTDLITALQDMTDEVLNSWNGSFTTEFIDNDGSSATSSVNSMVNDVLFYYEKYLRAAKVGIPAGVFSGSPIATNTEALYTRPAVSRQLLLKALDAFTNFYKGDGFNDQLGVSLQAYLIYIQGLTNSNAGLDQNILSKLNEAKAKINALDENLAFQVNNDNAKMLEAYDALQSVVILLKTDMMSALNIKVDYVDADGD